MEAVNTSLAQLSGEICLVWTQFMEIIVGQERVRTHLRDRYHQARVSSASSCAIQRPGPCCIKLTINDIFAFNGNYHGSKTP